MWFCDLHNSLKFDADCADFQSFITSEAIHLICRFRIGLLAMSMFDANWLEFFENHVLARRLTSTSLGMIKVSH